MNVAWLKVRLLFQKFPVIVDRFISDFLTGERAT